MAQVSYTHMEISMDISMDIHILGKPVNSTVPINFIQMRRWSSECSYAQAMDWIS